jgi:hypothetical protein
MKKSQVSVFQFVLFFLLGLGIFIAIGNLFRLQLDILTTDILTQSLGLTNSFLGSAIIYSFVECNDCKINITLLLPEKITHYYYKISFLNSGMNVSALDRPEYFFSLYHNLNYTIKFGGEAFSARPVILMFNGTNYKLEVG